MRERIFKAKRKNWKELPKEQWWVEGAIFEGKENSYIITNVKVTDEWEDSEIGADVIGYLVDHETICEPTGMADKNEKKIFEGDIVKLPAWMTNHGEYAVCKYIDSTNEVVAIIGFAFFDKNEKLIDSDEWDEFEIVGNIYDNPELI